MATGALTFFIQSEGQLLPPEIDVAEAKRLRATGMTWRAIGMELARQAGRRFQFWGPSVYDAVKKASKAEYNLFSQ